MSSPSGNFIEMCERIARGAKQAAGSGIDPLDRAFWLGLAEDWQQLAAGATHNGIFHLAAVARA